MSALPSPVVATLSQLLALDLANVENRSEPSSAAKPALRTLTWLDEPSLLELQAGVRAALGELTSGENPKIAIGLVTADPDRDWFDDQCHMRIDQAHEFRDKPANRCAVLFLLIPAALETTLRKTGLDNPGSPVDLDGLWPEVSTLIRAELPTEVARDAEVIATEMGRHADAFDVAVYLGAIAESPSVDTVGRELWRLGLIPDLGGEARVDLGGNRECVNLITSSQQPQADVAARLAACRLRRGEIYGEIQTLLSRADVNLAQPSTWLSVLADRDDLKRLSFHNWPLDTVPSTLEGIAVKGFFRGDGTCDPASKLLQPGGPNTPLHAGAKVKLSWAPIPRVPEGVVRWRVELVPASPDLAGDIAELPISEVAGGRKTTTFSLGEVAADDELRELVAQSQFRLRVTALDELAEIRSADTGEVVEGLSDDFYITDTDGEPVVSRSVSQPNVALARLFAAQQLRGTELSCVALPPEQTACIYRFSMDGTGQIDARIPVNSFVTTILSRITSLAEPSTFSLEVRSGNDLEPTALAAMATSRACEGLPTNLVQRRRDLVSAFSRLSLAVPAFEAVETNDWIAFLEKPARAYARSYVEALRASPSVEASQALLAVDTMQITMHHRGRRHRALLVLPFNPLRALWCAQYSAVLRELEDELLGLRFEDRVSSADLELLSSISPANYPLVATDVDGSPFVYNRTVGHATTLHLESEDPDPHLTSSLLGEALDLRRGRDAIDLPPDQLTDRLRLYLKTHTYLHRLHLLIVNSGTGAFVSEAIRGLVSKGLDDRQASNSDLQLAITAVDSSAMTPNPVPQLRSLQQDLHDSELVRTGTLLSPSVELTARESPRDEDCNVAVTIDAGTPRVELSSGTTDRTTHFHGLITPTSTTFAVDDSGASWSSQPARPNPREIGRTAADVGALAVAHSEAVAKVLEGSAGTPSLVISYDVDDIQRLERLHRHADWVIDVSRYTGSELLDSPADAFAGARSRRYVLDYSPDFRDGFGHRMTVSTEYRHELELLLQGALKELGFADLELSSTVLLDDLRSVSGRLALRLVEPDNYAREAAGVAVVARYLRQTGGLDETIVVPVDAHHDMFGTSRSRAANANGYRCDLLLVRPKAKSFEVEFVEIKQRTGPVGEGLYDTIASQTEATETLVESMFFAPSARIDHQLRRAFLTDLLLGYLDRTHRHGHINDPARLVVEERLNRLETGYDTLTAKRTGYIVNLTAAPQDPIEHRGTTIRLLTEADLAPTGLRSTLSEQQRGADLPPGQEQPDALGSTSQHSLDPSGDASPADGAQTGAATDHAARAVPQEVHVQPDVSAASGTAAEAAAEGDADEVGPSEVTVGLGVVKGTETPVDWTISTRGSPHLFVIGMPGQGKSWTVLRIIEMFAERRLPSLIFDYHGQFAQELPLKMPILDLADGLPFSPFEASLDKGRDNWKVNAYQVADILAFVGRLGPIQRDHVYSALLAAYAKGGFEAGKIDRLPSVSDFFSELEALEKSARGGQNASARLRSLLDFGLFREHPGDSIHGFLRNGAIVDFSQIPIEEVQNAGGAFLLRKLYREMYRWGETEHLRLAVVLDEAHRLAKDVTLPKLMKEGRKFGIVIVVASQNTNDFHADVLQNAGSKVVFRLNIGEAKRAAGFVRGRASTDLTAEIENLNVGEAFVQTSAMAQARKTTLYPFK